MRKWTAMMAMVMGLSLLAGLGLAQQKTFDLSLRPNTDVKAALQILFQMGGVRNYIIDPNIRGTVGPLNLTNTTVDEALKVILSQVGATFRKKDGRYEVIPIRKPGAQQQGRAGMSQGCP